MANSTGLRIINTTVCDGKLVAEVLIENKEWEKLIESGIGIVNGFIKVPDDPSIKQIVPKYDLSCFNYVGKVSAVDDADITPEMADDVMKVPDVVRRYREYNKMMGDTDIVVTDNSNQPSREDKSGQYKEAETHVNNIIQDFDKGNVTRTDTKRVYDRAGRALRDHDLARGIGKL